MSKRPFRPVFIFTGDRYWSDKRLVKNMINRLPREALIIQGGALGLDTIAKKQAKKLGFKTKTFKAKWSKYGRSAGPIRNRKMLKYAQKRRLVAVLAFHNNLRKSKGTLDMVILGLEHHVPVVLIRVQKIQ